MEILILQNQLVIMNALIFKETNVIIKDQLKEQILVTAARIRSMS